VKARAERTSWRPVGTNPLPTGEDILVYWRDPLLTDHEQVSIINYNEKYGVACPSCEGAECESMVRAEWITHWQPLPKAPAK